MSLRLSVVGALSFAACTSTHTPSQATQSASTLALSRDDALLYAVDTDNATLAVIDTQSETKLAEVAVGAGASRVVVGADDAIYVANRLAHSVSVITRGSWQEARRLEAGVEPVGLAVSSDGKTLYVVSAVATDTARHGTLLAIDAATGATRWDLALGEEPRSVALVDDAHAVVSLLKQGDVMFIDLNARRVDRAQTGLYGQLNATALQQASPSLAFAPDTVHPRGLVALAVSPDKTSVFALGNLSREAAATGWGGCAATLTSAPAMMQLDPTGTPHVDDLLSCSTADHMPTVITDGAPGGFVQDPTVFQGPAALAFDHTNAFAYVANQQSNNVVILRTAGGVGIGTGATVATVNVGAGPDGIAVRYDGTRAYVHNAFDHSVSVLQGTSGGGVARTKDITLATDVLSADAVAGRKLFFDATNRQMAGSTQGAACATCHLDNGREDGHVWVFAEGHRQTMSLAGGRLTGTAPFHWDGAFADLGSLMDHTTTGRMGGTGPTPAMEQQIQAYLATLPAPLNPKQLGGPTDAQARGALVFQRAACGTCHLGPQLTNNAFAHVGTDDGAAQAEFPPNGVNVPSLRGLARTAPFLHDGRAATLEDRIRLRQNENLHGLTAALTDQDVADLVDFLETL